jgi:hypothetical protein
MGDVPQLMELEIQQLILQEIQTVSHQELEITHQALVRHEL